MTDTNAARPTPTEDDDRLALDERFAYRIPEVAHLLGIGEWTVRSLLKNKKLRYRKVGKYFLIPRGDLERYLAADEPQSA